MCFEATQVPQQPRSTDNNSKTTVLVGTIISYHRYDSFSEKSSGCYEYQRTPRIYPTESSPHSMLDLICTPVRLLLCVAVQQLFCGAPTAGSSCLGTARSPGVCGWYTRSKSRYDASTTRRQSNIPTATSNLLCQVSTRNPHFEQLALPKTFRLLLTPGSYLVREANQTSSCNAAACCCSAAASCKDALCVQKDVATCCQNPFKQFFEVLGTFRFQKS